MGKTILVIPGLDHCHIILIVCGITIQNGFFFRENILFNLNVTHPVRNHANADVLPNVTVIRDDDIVFLETVSAHFVVKQDLDIPGLKGVGAKFAGLPGGIFT